MVVAGFVTAYMTAHIRIIMVTGLAALAVMARISSSAELEPYKNPALPVEKRVEDLLRRMTLEEKVDQVSGADPMATRPNARLGIPALKMSDGPHGLRWDKATAFPTAVSWGASWDVDLIERIGMALGREARAKGRNILLGPCINIHRTPLGGRDFESFGEDPYLVSRLVVAYVKGVQSQKIGTSVKHFACNNQEWERGTIDVKVDERALHEIYLPAFRAAVQEAGAWTLMAAYNRVNGPYCAANTPLLTDILKKQWGFKGLVMSDWGACHGTVDSANAGLDLEMPGPGEFFRGPLLAAIKKGEVSGAVLDDKIRRILRVMFWAGLFDGIEQREKGALDTEEHRALAREAAGKGIVLLKNARGVLPLSRERVKSIAVIGPNAAVARVGGGGSSAVTPFYSVSPLDGLKKKCGDKVSIRYALGCPMPNELSPVPPHNLTGLRAEYFGNKDLRGEPVVTRTESAVDFNWGGDSPAKGINADGFSARWSGKLAPTASGKYELGMTSDDGFRIYLNGKLLIDSWVDQAEVTKTASVDLKAGQSYDLRIEYYENAGGAMAKLGWVLPGNLLQDAVRAAAQSDVAIVFAGLSAQFESESFDRQNLELPGDQNALIEAVARTNKNTIVVLNNGAPVLMNRWIDRVPAIVEAWYPGQECGNAIADVLFGDVDPSGKLPMTFVKALEDSPSYGNYPGKDGVVRYAEGIFVGYRHFDTKNVEPLFPFGHGLSYTKFEYSDLKIEPRKNAVRFVLQNVGDRPGAEVVQLYVHDAESSVPRPAKELKAFKMVNLRPGEKQTVNFGLEEGSFAFYDVASKRWLAEPGKFEILVGSSSRDIRLRAPFVLAAE